MNRERHGRTRSHSSADVDLIDRVKESATELARTVKDGTRTATTQVARAAGEVIVPVAEGVRVEAERVFERQRGRAVSRVAGAGKVARQAAHAMRAVKADQLADVTDAAAERIEGLGEYLVGRSFGELADDVQGLITRHEAVAVAAMFVAGFALARYAKAGVLYERPAEAGRPAGGGGRRKRRKDS